MSEIELDLTNLKNSIDKLKESIEAYNNLKDETLRSFIEDELMAIRGMDEKTADSIVTCCHEYMENDEEIFKTSIWKRR